VGKKRMMGKEERVRQTTLQGIRKRRNTLEMMMMMMVNTEAVRIAKMNPEAPRRRKPAFIFPLK
jgi:hypothetical protein